MHICLKNNVTNLTDYMQDDFEPEYRSHCGPTITPGVAMPLPVHLISYDENVAMKIHL